MKKQLLLATLICLFFCTNIFNYVFAEGRGSTAGTPYGACAKQGNFFLYAYAQPGEKIDYLITKTNKDGTMNWSVQLYSPNGPVGSACTVGANVGNNCTIAKLTVGATEGGIWTLHVIPLGTNQNDAVSFDLSVYTSSDAPILGRVYTENLHGFDKDSPAEPDFSLYFLTIDGYKYSALYKGLIGKTYSIVGDNLGVRKSASSCESAYSSFSYNGPLADRGPEVSTCSNKSKIFFNAFSTDLPASALRYDIGGSTQITVSLAMIPVMPSLSVPVFTRGTSCTQSGTVSFTANSYSGRGFISYDANNDGDFTDAADRLDTVNFVSGTNSFSFNGLDGQGNPISVSQIINIKVATDKLGETHFVMADIEVFRGGIEVTRLNGDGAPDKTIYWDDRTLPTGGNCSSTSLVNGSAGVNSTGGVHEWNSCGGNTGGAQTSGTNANNGINGSWGDSRLIDNWAYYIPSAATQTITAPAEVLYDYGDLTAAWPTPKAASTGTDTNGDCVIDNNDVANINAVWAGTSIDFEQSQHFSADASADGYDDGLTFPPGTLVRGQPYSFFVKVNSNAANKTVYYGVWFDWNNNGSFSDDVDCAGAASFYSGNGITPASGGMTIINVPICVPTDALEPDGVSVNDYKVRVIASDIPITSSMYNAILTNGEIEDYKLPLIVLPVTFGNFYATSTTSCNIQLKFQTYSEYYSKQFNIERSINGITWETITSLPSNSVGNGLSNYEYVDNQPKNGINLYRIKQIDNSGQFQYSNVIISNNQCKTSTGIITYPNPVKNKLAITIPANLKNTQIKISNSIGQEMIAATNTNNNSVYYIDTEKFASGIYLLHIIQNNSIIYTDRFIKQ